jgi:hypothetical protein
MGRHTKVGLSNTAFPLFLCLAIEGCGGRVHSAWTAFVPPDTMALVGVRLDQLQATPAYRKLAGQHRLPRFDEFRSDTGVDPERDIRELLLAYDGQNALWIARGTFQLKQAGSPRNGSFTVIDKDTALAGPPAVVRAAIDRYKSGRGSAPGSLLSRVQALTGDPQIWAVTSGWTGLPPETLRQMGNAANLDRVLRSTESTTLTADLRAGLHAVLAAECRNEGDGLNLSAELRGLLGLMRSVPKNRPDLLRALDGIQVTQQGRSVKVNVDLPQDLFDRLLDGGR